MQPGRYFRNDPANLLHRWTKECVQIQFNKSQGFLVVDNGGGIDITNVAETSNTYNTDLNLFDKEEREKNVAKSSGGFVTFGKAMVVGIETHNFLSNISLRTTT